MGSSEIRQPGSILFERYQIVRMLGQGGRGEVYLCYDTKLHNSPVALKLLPFDNLWDENAILDMQTEFLSAKKLSHKNVVRLNHFDISEAGAVIEMEFIEGISMHERIYSVGKLGEKEVKHIITQLCDALDYAHSEGVVHRDIKPANVLLASDPNNMTALQNLKHHPKYVRPDQYSVKLVDFGISRGVAALDRLNNNRCFSGTLQYMSPEHCMGEKTDARSDIYSVGCMMYEAVTGAAIFSGDDVAEKQVNQEPTPPRKVNNAPISREFETVILKALAKNPKLRFQSAKEMKEAIEANQALVLGTYHTEFEKSVRKIKKEARARKVKNEVSEATGSVISLLTKIVMILAVIGCLGGAGYGGYFWFVLKPEKEAKEVREKVDKLRVEIAQAQRQDPSRARDMTRQATRLLLQHSLKKEQPLIPNPFEKDDGDVKNRFIRIMAEPADALVGIVETKQIADSNTKIGPFNADSVRIIVMREGYETRDMKIDLSALERGGERRVTVTLDAIHKIQSESGVSTPPPPVQQESPAPAPVPVDPQSPVESEPVPTPPLQEVPAETIPPATTGPASGAELSRPEVAPAMETYTPAPQPSTTIVPDTEAAL